MSAYKNRTALQSDFYFLKNLTWLNIWSGICYGSQKRRVLADEESVAFVKFIWFGDTVRFESGD